MFKKSLFAALKLSSAADINKFRFFNFLLIYEWDLFCQMGSRCLLQLRDEQSYSAVSAWHQKYMCSKAERMRKRR
jgi:hypothetical protein